MKTFQIPTLRFKGVFFGFFSLPDLKKTPMEDILEEDAYGR